MGRRIAGVASDEEIKNVKDFLNGYRLNAKLLRLDRYEREYFEERGVCDYESVGEVPLAKARMYRIRHFITSLPNSEEKIFLYYHYVRGINAEKCGEMLGISRSSAFRLKNRALNKAALAFGKWVSDQMGEFTPCTQ